MESARLEREITLNIKTGELAPQTGELKASGIARGLNGRAQAKRLNKSENTIQKPKKRTSSKIRR